MISNIFIRIEIILMHTNTYNVENPTVNIFKYDLNNKKGTILVQQF